MRIAGGLSLSSGKARKSGGVFGEEVEVLFFLGPEYHCRALELGGVVEYADFDDDAAGGFGGAGGDVDSAFSAEFAGGGFGDAGEGARRSLGVAKIGRIQAEEEVAGSARRLQGRPLNTELRKQFTETSGLHLTGSA